jgi:carboxyvinyl-carboxyphosphonate phosphorylmutase
MKALRDGTRPADLEGLPSSDLTAAVKRNADYERWIEQFLGGK